MKALEGPFEEFVKSDVVNEYLQTIGPPVKDKLIEDGVPHNYLIISGYEEERGNWAACYDNKIRFGNEISTVEGLKIPMVLTPRFFYGKNINGEDLEYRIGLVKGEGGDSFVLYPILLLKSGERFQAKILEVFCVLHQGIYIRFDWDQELRTREKKEIYGYYQFLSCFWNIDDFLRKQNVNFKSDLGGSNWKDVELFSGRIIDQMLQKITTYCIKDPAFLILDMKEQYWRNLITAIERRMVADSFIEDEDTRILMQNLCSYANTFSDYSPFDKFIKKTPEIIPYLIRIKETRNYFVGYSDSMEIERVLKNIIKKVPLIRELLLEDLQKFLKSESLPGWMRFLMFNQLDIDEKLRNILITTLRKEPNLKKEIIKKFESLFDIPKEGVYSRSLYSILIEEAPDLITREGFRKIYAINQTSHMKSMERQLGGILRLTKHKHPSIRKWALEIKNDPSIKTFLIDQLSNENLDYGDMDRLIELLGTWGDKRAYGKLMDLVGDEELDLRGEAALTLAKLGDTRVIPILMDFLASEDYILRTFMPEALGYIGKVTKSEIDKIISLFSSPNAGIRFAAISAYHSLFDSNPTLINQSDINQLVPLITDPCHCDENEYFEQLDSLYPALSAYKAVCATFPQFVTPEGIKNIVQVHSAMFKYCYDAQKVFKKRMVSIYHLILETLPKYIPLLIRELISLIENAPNGVYHWLFADEFQIDEDWEHYYESDQQEYEIYKVLKHLIMKAPDLALPNVVFDQLNVILHYLGRDLEEILCKRYPQRVTTLIKNLSADHRISNGVKMLTDSFLKSTFEKLPHLIEDAVPTFIQAFSEVIISIYTEFKRGEDVNSYLHQVPRWLEETFIATLKPRAKLVLAYLDQCLTVNASPDVQLGALLAFGVIGEQAPSYLDPRGIDNFWVVLAAAEAEFQQVLLFTYAYMLRKAPQFIDKTKFPVIFKYMWGSNELIAKAAYYTVEGILEKGSKSIYQEVKKIIEKRFQDLLSGEKVIEADIRIYGDLVENLPQLINQRGIDRIYEMSFNPEISSAAFDVYKRAMNKVPQFITEEKVQILLDFIKKDQEDDKIIKMLNTVEEFKKDHSKQTKILNFIRERGGTVNIFMVASALNFDTFDEFIPLCEPLKKAGLIKIEMGDIKLVPQNLDEE